MAEYKINRLDAVFDHQGSPFEGALAPAQDQAAFASETTKIHERGRMSHSIARETG